MERKKSNQAALLLLVALFLLQNLAFSSASVEEQKNYYSPNPHSGSHHHSPSHGSGGSHRTPSHSTPSHGSGGGSYGGSPPANCGNPPSIPTPSTPSGGQPSIPTPSTPSGGGGYSYPPPTYGDNTPTTPTPVIVSPPTFDTPPSTPIVDPGTGGTPTIPGISTPSSPPFSFDPNSPPFTCIFWGSHPTYIWGLLGYWGTVGGLFGATGTPGFGGANMSLQEALLNKQVDPMSSLYREATASLLNSMAAKKFPYTTNQVRDMFVAALSSDKTAVTQAHLFKLANEGKTPKV